MTRREATREACEIIALAFHSIGDMDHASDGFCDQCPNGEGKRMESYYRNDGKALEYVRQAVVQRLKRDGFKINPGWDSATGKEIK